MLTVPRRYFCFGSSLLLILAVGIYTLVPLLCECHILATFRYLNDHLSGKELFIRFTACAFRKLLSIYVFSYFPFGFEGKIWDLIVTVPDHYLSFYLTTEKQDKSTTIYDKLGKYLTQEHEILNRRTEYFSDLYNYETDGEPTVCPHIPDEEHHPILREEMEAAVKALKMGISAGVDNIPAELVQAGGEAIMDILTSICNTI